MKIIWSPLAIERVNEIADYIARDSPGAATKWVDRLFEKVQILRACPQSGRRVPECKRDDIREIIFGNYRIIYRLETSRVSVLTVRHGKQILPMEDLT